MENDIHREHARSAIYGYCAQQILQNYYSFYMLSLFTIIPHPSPTFQLGSRYLACHMTNMQINCRKNSSRSGSAPPTNPATLLQRFANLLGKGCIKYGVTGSVRVRVRVSINI